MMYRTTHDPESAVKEINDRVKPDRPDEDNGPTDEELDAEFNAMDYYFGDHPPMSGADEDDEE